MFPNWQNMFPYWSDRWTIGWIHSWMGARIHFSTGETWGAIFQNNPQAGGTNFRLPWQLGNQMDKLLEYSANQGAEEQTLGWQGLTGLEGHLSDQRNNLHNWRDKWETRGTICWPAKIGWDKLSSDQWGKLGTKRTRGTNSQTGLIEWAAVRFDGQMRTHRD